MSETTRDVTAPAATRSLPANSIGLFGTTSSTLANIAPALSVFLTIPAIVLSMGSMAPWAFVLAAIAILATGNSLIEFTRRMPSAGGFISYLTRAVRGSRTGTFLGSMTFYLLLFIYPVSVGSVVVFIGSWTVSYANWSPGIWIWVTLGAMVAGLPVLLRGTGISVKAAFVMFLTEAVALVLFAVVVLVRAHSALAVPFHAIGGSPGGFAGIGGLTFGLAVFAYVGWENSAPLAEESKNPRRTIPLTVVLSIGVVMLVFFLAAYALVVGYASWQGSAKGIASIGSLANPYLTLTSHYVPWLHLIMFLIGVTSSFGCYLAAALPGSRYIYHGSRAGLLPAQLSRVSARTGVPYASITLYVALMVATTVILDLILHSAGSIATYEAGISTVPLLIIYGATCALLPFFVWRTDRGTFSVLRHIVFPLLGVGVVGYGIWESINPGQAAPADHYWYYVLAYLVVGAAGGLYALRSRGPRAEVLSRGLE
ncbi:MAG TPA: APC family permease [Streptosporangiaceae bacterium]|nr:APC family permease [Streptosporangiaceae bacterium]